MTETSAAAPTPPPTPPEPVRGVRVDGPADLTLGAFSDTAPWLVEPAGLRWRRAVPSLRFAQRRELPELTRARRVPPGLRVVTVAG